MSATFFAKSFLSSRPGRIYHVLLDVRPLPLPEPHMTFLWPFVFYLTDAELDLSFVE